MAWKLAESISSQLKLCFISPSLKKDKPSMKQLSVEAKIEAWAEIYDSGSVVLDKVIEGKNIIIIDDLYQSGTTIWKYASFLKEHGARVVCGVVCVKSLKDSDNV